MCGIAGQFGLVTPVFAKKSLERLGHRGPDGQGTWVGEQAVLVHTRLAIIDLSEAGAQPKAYATQPTGSQRPDEGSHESGDSQTGDLSPFSTDNRQLTTDKSSFVLVFNGEIYNYRELRAELEAEGEEFTSDSDTEVLLRLLVREGEACLSKLAGMFAFTYWNEAAGTGLLARDPLGIKPLYFREEGGTLSFASESHVLRQDCDEIDVGALRDFFLWGSVPEPRTLNAAVRQIPAGHLLTWQNERSEVRDWAGSRMSKVGSRMTRGGQLEMSASELTREALLESMRRHLVSDVPVGIFLSGGIDSTVILALARDVLGLEADLRTFSIGFDDPAFDESGLARRTAEHFGARHTEWRMTAEEGADEISAFMAAVDQPTIDGFNTWCVSKLARREGMKVVLSGLGGDEIFAGYGSFEHVPRFVQLHRYLGPLRPLAARLLETRRPGTPWRRLAAFLRGGGSWLEAYQTQRGIFTPQEAEQLALAFTSRTPAEPEWGWPDCPKDGRDAVSALELTRYMRNQLLRDSDVFSMAHGLELRVPLVDARLLSTVSSIPAAVRLRREKKLLLEAVPEVPAWIKNQPKRGFRFPFQAWMEGEFGDLLAEAQQKSPVPLNAWYRTWAVAVALRFLSNIDSK